jgi:energy-converting hydrogenase Eha subunit H
LNFSILSKIFYDDIYPWFNNLGDLCVIIIIVVVVCLNGESKKEIQEQKMQRDKRDVEKSEKINV